MLLEELGQAEVPGQGDRKYQVFYFSARTAARWITQAAPRLAPARFNIRCAIIGLIAQL